MGEKESGVRGGRRRYVNFAGFIGTRFAEMVGPMNRTITAVFGN